MLIPFILKYVGEKCEYTISGCVLGSTRHLVRISSRENSTGDAISNIVCHLCLLCNRKFFQISSFSLPRADIVFHQLTTSIKKVHF